MVHWVKGYKDANGRIRDAQQGDYPFAKYNKKVRGVPVSLHMQGYAKTEPSSFSVSVSVRA
jgi:hypothetical protein